MDALLVNIYDYMCVCVPILVTTFPEWLSDTEPLPHTPSTVRLSSLCLACTCTVLPVWQGGCHRRRSVTLQSLTATLIPLFSSSELTGCGYPGLLDRKNCSDMCPQWESNPRLPVYKASTLSTRPGSPLCDYMSFSTVFKLYQKYRRQIMKGCV